MAMPPQMMAQMMGPQTQPRLAEEGEYVELPLPEDDVLDTEDGGADIFLKEEGAEHPTASDDEFYKNLAADLPPDYLDELASSMLQKIERDRQSRSKRDDQYAEGLRRTGIGKDAPGGADFEGAARAVHPMLTKAAVEFEARAMKEVFPAEGPCKAFIPGTKTKERLEKANRKVRCFNWLMTTQMLEFRPALEQALTQAAIGGVQYIRLRWDERLRRPVSNTIHVDQLFMPFDAPSLWAAERIVFQDDITEMEYRSRVHAGTYIDIDAIPPSMPPEDSKSAQARAKGEGKERDPYNQDGVRRTYEVNTYLDDLEDKLPDSPFDKKDIEGRALPYLVYIDESTSKVAGVFRNWEKNDKRMERLHWIVEWPFVQWTGAYPIGMIHLIGSLSAAATGALRALLDAGHIANQQTVFQLKGGSVPGQTQQVRPTQINQITGNIGADDIRKLLYPLTPSQPSPTLFQLLGFLVESGTDMVRTTFENLSENNPNAPVGTTYALIEQGLAVVSTIIGRMHFAMFNTLNVLHRILRMYLTDDSICDEAGEVLAYRADFQGPADVIPVSDPGIPSDAHRYAQMQVVAQRADMKPTLYNQRRVEKMILERLRVPDAESFLIPFAEPQEMNAANENAAATFGKPLSAFPHQDHLAHLQTHIDFMSSPLLGMLPNIAPKVLPAMLEHISQHVALWYLGRIYQTIDQAMPNSLDDYMQISDPAVKAELDRTIAEASKTVLGEAQQVLNGVSLPAVIQKAQQMLQQMNPPQPTPISVQMQRNQIEQQNNQQKGQLAQAALQQKNQATILDLQDKREQRQHEMQQTAMKQQGETQRQGGDASTQQQIAELEQMGENARAEQANATKEKTNLEDNQTALAIAADKIENGAAPGMTTGRGFGSEGRDAAQ